MIFKRSLRFLYSIRINYNVINLSFIFVTSALGVSEFRAII